MTMDPGWLVLRAKDGGDAVLDGDELAGELAETDSGSRAHWAAVRGDVAPGAQDRVLLESAFQPIFVTLEQVEAEPEPPRE